MRIFKHIESGKYFAEVVHISRMYDSLDSLLWDVYYEFDIISIWNGKLREKECELIAVIDDPDELKLVDGKVVIAKGDSK